ncbi:hypothetical protein F4604DRAFT_1691201 [Suillus subluteus]|nr:hypothetical protein F4604DRAFT_1691201 [Suillus subluteus]
MGDVGRSDHHSAAPVARQRTFLSPWRSDPNGATEYGARSPSHTVPQLGSGGASSLACYAEENRDASDIQLREPHIVDVPYTAAKPRKYHPRKKTATDSPRPHTDGVSLQQATTSAASHCHNGDWNTVAS